MQAGWGGCRSSATRAFQKDVAAPVLRVVKTLAREYRPTAQHVIDNLPQRIDVGGWAEVELAAALQLWRHKLHGTDNLVGRRSTVQVTDQASSVDLTGRVS